MPHPDQGVKLAHARLRAVRGVCFGTPRMALEHHPATRRSQSR
jgi:hypothetical protein